MILCDVKDFKTLSDMILKMIGEKMRGYYGIGIHQPKYVQNIGTLWRTAYNFIETIALHNANFIFTIGKFQNQKTDTTKAWRHIPFLQFETLQQMEDTLKDTQIICVETYGNRQLKHFCHPERAIYLLGSESIGLPEDYVKDKICVSIDSKQCLNVATAGAIIMYDRANI